MEAFSRQQIADGIIAIVKAMTPQLDFKYSGGIGQDTSLVRDLDFKSVDMVEFAVAVEKRFKCKGLPFQELIAQADGDFDMSIAELTDFVHAHLPGSGTGNGS